MTELKDKLKVYFDKFENLVDEAISECIEDDKIIEFGYEFSFSQNRYSWPVNGVLHDGKLCWCSVLTDEEIYIEPMNFKDKLLFLTQLSEGVELKYSEVHGRESIFDEESIKKIKALKELDFSEVIQLQGTPDGYFYLFFQTVDFNYNVRYNLKIKGNDDVYNFFDKLEEMPTRQFLEDGGFLFGGFRIPTEELINAKQKHVFIYIKDIYRKEKNTKNKF